MHKKIGAPKQETSTMVKPSKVVGGSRVKIVYISPKSRQVEY